MRGGKVNVYLRRLLTFSGRRHVLKTAIALSFVSLLLEFFALLNGVIYKMLIFFTLPYHTITYCTVPSVLADSFYLTFSFSSKP